MIAARWGLLFAAALLGLLALGALEPGLQPSALRLMATSVVALLAPLFWPGAGVTPGGTAARIVIWSVAAGAVAAVAVMALGSGRQPLPRVAEACAMLCLLLGVSLLASAALEVRAFGATEASLRRELASRVVVLVMAVAGSLPLWLGPAAEALASGSVAAVDAALAASPLVHLALASGNDLLRNQWLYQHSNLASLQFEYPGLQGVLPCYGVLALALGWLALRPPGNGRPDRPQEKTR